MEVNGKPKKRTAVDGDDTLTLSSFQQTVRAVCQCHQKKQSAVKLVHGPDSRCFQHLNMDYAHFKLNRLSFDAHEHEARDTHLLAALSTIARRTEKKYLFLKYTFEGQPVCQEVCLFCFVLY